MTVGEVSSYDSIVFPPMIFALNRSTTLTSNYFNIEYSAPERAPRPAELSSETGGVEQRFRCR